MINCIVLNAINMELYKANIQKKKQAHRDGKQYDRQGTWHFGSEKVEQKRQYAADKQ